MQVSVHACEFELWCDYQFKTVLDRKCKFKSLWGWGKRSPL